MIKKVRGFLSGALGIVFSASLAWAADSSGATTLAENPRLPIS